MPIALTSDAFSFDCRGSCWRRRVCPCGNAVSLHPPSVAVFFRTLQLTSQPKQAFMQLYNTASCVVYFAHIVAYAAVGWPPICHLALLVAVRGHVAPGASVANTNHIASQAIAATGAGAESEGLRLEWHRLGLLCVLLLSSLVYRYYKLLFEAVESSAQLLHGLRDVLQQRL